MGHDYGLQLWVMIMGDDYGLRLLVMIMGYDYGRYSQHTLCKRLDYNSSFALCEVYNN